MYILVVYAKYLAYVVIRKVYNTWQQAFWIFNLTYLDLCRSRRLSNYSWSAQLLDIRFRYKLDLLIEPSGPGNFITTHNAFVSPSYVLQDHVSLYYVNPHEAVFVEVPENIDVTHSKNGSYLRAVQFQNARRVIKLPIESFNRLAEEVGDPTGKVLFVTNTARCGSTLLSQIYENTGVAISFSEPDALNVLTKYKNRLSKQSLDTLVINCIRILCKPSRNRKIEAYVLKLTAPTIDEVPKLIRLYPNGKHIFMYRDGMKVARSILKISSQFPLLQLTFKLTRLHPILNTKSFEAINVPARNFKLRLPSEITVAVFIWGIICKKYMDLRKQGIEIVAVKYEDFINNPRDSIQEVFKYNNLPPELTERGLTALKTYNSTKDETSNVNRDDRLVIDAVCDKLGVPRVPGKCRLPGTITCA